MSIAILIAHKHEPENDKALDIALACIVRNTRTDYQLLVDTKTPDCPYRVWNRLARSTDAEWLLFTNSDVFMAPGWDVPMLDIAQPDTIVTGVVVEPGAIGVNERNIDKSFGMTPESFDRKAFEEWITTEPGGVPGGIGWFMPSLHHRETFLRIGGFDTSLGVFPEPLDEEHWNRWKASGRRIERVMSYSYHLQNWSNPVEQSKEVRKG